MEKKNKNIQIVELGIKSFTDALLMQEKYFNEIINIKRSNRKSENKTVTKNFMLWVEHTPVITLGKSGKDKNLLLNKNELKKKKIEYYQTNRGGDITFHGPGQIVGYPILDLDNFFTDIHKYLRFLEEIVILTLKEYNLSCERSQGETGVWMDVGTPFARKICAMGVKASRWVTMHGFALNVNTDLSYFNNIIPCGIQNKSVTSIEKELGCKIKINDIENAIKKHLINLFNIELI